MTTKVQTRQERINEAIGDLEDVGFRISSALSELEDALEAAAPEQPSEPALLCAMEGCRAAAVGTVPLDLQSGLGVPVRLELPLCMRHWAARP